MTAPLLSALQQRFAPYVRSLQEYRGQLTAVIQREGLVAIAQHLKTDPALAFDFLMDLTAVDYLKFGKTQRSAPTLKTPSPLPYYMTPKPVAETWNRQVQHDEQRFDVVYHFFSSHYHHRLRLRVPLAAADPSVPTLTSLWAGANWFEREVYDMFGITFTGHPDLRRLLMYPEFEGHPLRKDYPIDRRQPLLGPNV
jgi:NADH-quinone oxidoreductase subunit C